MTDIFEVPTPDNELLEKAKQLRLASIKTSQTNNCLLYTSDAADE